MSLAGLSRLTIALTVVLTAACSVDGVEPAPLRADPFSIARGREIAEFHCATCHQTGLTGPSPSLMAPPFHSIHISYSRLSFRRAMEDAVNEGGHAMPGYQLDRGQVDDLVAYLESVKREPSRD